MGEVPAGEPGSATKPIDDPLPDDAVPAVRDALLNWYDSHGRGTDAVPWRDADDPYRILVAEVMAQQTQLGRVADAWRSFVDRWATPHALATANRSDVIGFWSDHRLGYNNRARYLHEAAEQIVESFDGDVPHDPEALETLPGVGPYTASAVAAFAFDRPEAVVDTNVKRVLYRAFDVPDEDEAFRRGAAHLLPESDPARWNHALMDLGAIVCEPTPRCDEEPCPWRDRCRAYATGDFTAPDVPTQPAFEGSRRQARGRVLAALRDGPQPLDDLGPRVRVDYDPGDADDERWLVDLLADLADDGLVSVSDGEARLRE